MGRGETFQIISFCLIFIGGLCALAARVLGFWNSWLLVIGVIGVIGGLCGLAGSIFGLWGSRISGRGNLETIGLLKTNVEAARKRQEPVWTPFKRVKAVAGISPLAEFAIIQFRLWSDDNTIPLMIRIASNQDGEIMNEVAGPSGVVKQVITENQTFYISLSHPKIEYKVSVLGYESLTGL
jgi:hypothetical protein